MRGRSRYKIHRWCVFCGNWSCPSCKARANAYWKSARGPLENMMKIVGEHMARESVELVMFSILERNR